MSSPHPNYFNRNRTFAYATPKALNSCAVIAQPISVLVFATWTVQFHFCLNLKFQASWHLLGLYRLVCVGPGRNSRRPVFSHCSSVTVYIGGMMHSSVDTGCFLTKCRVLHNSHRSTIHYENMPM